MLKNEIIKILKVFLKRLLFILCLLMILYNIIFFLYKTVTHKEYFEILGISMFSVQTEAMENDLYKNDLVICKRVGINEVFENDIIVWNVKGNIRINKLIEIYNSREDGRKIYVTKFTKNYQPDTEELTENRLMGIKIMSFRHLGFLLKILQSNVTTIIIFIILCIYFIHNRSIYIRNKKRARKKVKYNNMNY